jgi:hypothetical protein
MACIQQLSTVGLWPNADFRGTLGMMMMCCCPQYTAVASFDTTLCCGCIGCIHHHRLTDMLSLHSRGPHASPRVLCSKILLQKKLPVGVHNFNCFVAHLPSARLISSTPSSFSLSTMLDMLNYHTTTCVCPC